MSSEPEFLTTEFLARSPLKPKKGLNGPLDACSPALIVVLIFVLTDGFAKPRGKTDIGFR